MDGHLFDPKNLYSVRHENVLVSIFFTLIRFVKKLYI
jgi:hypothetical protein